MKHFNSLLTACLLFMTLGLYAQPEAGMHSEAGKCYAKCIIADQYETVTEKVLVKEASSKVSISPATFETVTEQVLAKEAGNSLSVIPATFETVSEQKIAQEASTSISIQPATFETMTERKLAKEAPRAIAGALVSGQMGEEGTLTTSAARFENASEQVLVKAAYTELRIIPATFETVSEEKLVAPAYSTLKVVPAVYETVTEQVLSKEGYTVLKVIPAEYETVTEQVLVKAAYSTISTSPAVYETVTEQKLAQEAGTRIERVPAEFETVTETIQTAAASTKWVKKKADRNCLSADPNDCLVWCLVEIPAQHRTVTKQVRKACAAGWTASGDDCIRTVEIPAKYTTISYQKLVNPASSTKTEVPAKYTTRTYRKLKSAARTEATNVPAVYTTYSYQKLVTPAHTVSVQVPARYETITYQKLKSPATTEVIEIPATYRTRTFQTLASDAMATIVPCGNRVILENVNFETGSAVLKASSMAEIRRIAQQLKGDPGSTAKLIGHTDNQGGEEMNHSLSHRRAKAVYDALVDAGIAASRLSYEGMGESSPIATNETAAGRRKNRRTEMVTSGTTGETDCNTYTTISYQKLSRDAQPVVTEIPARYETVTSQVVAKDAMTTSTEIPVQYATRSYKKLASAAATTLTETPAQYREITKRQLVKPGGFTEWREVVCDADITPSFYRRVQQALNDRGYNVGAVDGIIGAATKSQLTKFQRDNNLPIGRLDFETLKALGVRQ